MFLLLNNQLSLQMVQSALTILTDCFKTFTFSHVCKSKSNLADVDREVWISFQILSSKSIQHDYWVRAAEFSALFPTQILLLPFTI